MLVPFFWALATGAPTVDASFEWSVEQFNSQQWLSVELPLATTVSLSTQHCSLMTCIGRKSPRSQLFSQMYRIHAAGRSVFLPQYHLLGR
jgi:hypothetical protein